MNREEPSWIKAESDGSSQGNMVIRGGKGPFDEEVKSETFRPLGRA
jgi:hypothetical protein